MQKRFCTCGQAVIVNYVSRNGVWKPLLVAQRGIRVGSKSSSPCCPGCGTPLSIDRLR